MYLLSLLFDWKIYKFFHKPIKAQYDNEDINMIDSMFSSTSGGVMCFLDKKKQLPGDEFDISVWKPLDTKGKPINQDEPLIYNHYSGMINDTKISLAVYIK